MVLFNNWYIVISDNEYKNNTIWQAYNWYAVNMGKLRLKDLASPMREWLILTTFRRRIIAGGKNNNYKMNSQNIYNIYINIGQI